MKNLVSQLTCPRHCFLLTELRLYSLTDSEQAWSNAARRKWNVSVHLHWPPDAFRTRVFFFITTRPNWCISTLTKNASEVETTIWLLTWVTRDCSYSSFHWRFKTISSDSTLGEWWCGCWEVLGSEDLELDASVDWLKAGGKMQLRVAHLKDKYSIIS